MIVPAINKNIVVYNMVKVKKRSITGPWLVRKRNSVVQNCRMN
jgi:hypothetical protein